MRTAFFMFFVILLSPVVSVQAATADAKHVSTVVGHAEVMDFSAPVSRIAVATLACWIT